MYTYRPSIKWTSIMHSPLRRVIIKGVQHSICSAVQWAQSHTTYSTYIHRPHIIPSPFSEFCIHLTEYVSWSKTASVSAPLRLQHEAIPNIPDIQRHQGSVRVEFKPQQRYGGSQQMTLFVSSCLLFLWYFFIHQMLWLMWFDMLNVWQCGGATDVNLKDRGIHDNCDKWVCAQY